MAHRETDARTGPGPRGTGGVRVPRARTAAPSSCTDDASLRVEACGICGTDVERARGTLPVRYPVIPGHEPVGVIEEIGPEAAARWGVGVGDRVAVDPFLPCGTCRDCLGGAYELCHGWPGVRSYGSFPITNAPGLWGGFANPPLPASERDRVPRAGPRPGRRRHALQPVWAWACAGASRRRAPRSGRRRDSWGAASVVSRACSRRRPPAQRRSRLPGLPADAHKLARAGARRRPHRRGRHRRPRRRGVRGHGRPGASTSSSTSRRTPRAPPATRSASCGWGGTIVYGGLKGAPVDGFPLDDVALKGAPRRRRARCRRRRVPHRHRPDRRGLGACGARLQTHRFGLDDAVHAIQVLAGEVPGEHPVNVVVEP